MSTEKRHFHRVPFAASIQLAAAEQRWPATLLDISLKGALVAPPQGCKLAVGAVCMLELHLDEAETIIQMRTRVAHVTDHHLGLRCDQIDAESLTHLRRLIELNLGDAELANRELSQLRA